MVDAIFAERRLAEIYDRLDDDRSDLEVYVALVDELGARSVLDIGCGTGTFACLLAQRGKEVTGVDPAIASLDVARRKPGAGRVRWIGGDATALPPLRVDLVTMTANAAQVFLTDEDWISTLSAARSALGRGGWLVFEVRDPAREAWREWNREQSYRRLELAEVGPVESWVDLTDVSPPFVSFRWTYVFEADGAVLTSDSTLRFRSSSDVRRSLVAAGFMVQDVRDAPDRPGCELVFIARRSGDSRPPNSVAQHRPGDSRRTAMRGYQPAMSFDEANAEVYDELARRGDEDATVAFLAEVAGGGPALELAVGTGRIALPLAERGIRVDGIDFSPPMVAKLRAKPGGEALSITMGDFAQVGVAGTYRLIYVVFNSLFNLVSQDDQVRCFENVAAHLGESGAFVVESCYTLAFFDRLRGAQYVEAEDIEVDAVRLDLLRIDPTTQLLYENHVRLSAVGVTFNPVVHRYTWPSELDLMARIAGLRLKERWGGWNREPFRSTSTNVVSVYAR